MGHETKRTLTSRSKGVVFVELAVVLVFLLSSIVLTIDVSYAIYEYQTLVKQVRSGVRYLSVQPILSNQDQKISIIKKAKCLVRTATLDCSHAPLLPQLSLEAEVCQLNSQNTCVVISDSADNVNLRSISTSSASPGAYPTTVNLTEVSVTGFVHHFLGVVDITFPEIKATMRQSN